MHLLSEQSWKVENNMMSREEKGAWAKKVGNHCFITRY